MHMGKIEHLGVPQVQPQFTPTQGPVGGTTDVQMGPDAGGGMEKVVQPRHPLMVQDEQRKLQAGQEEQVQYLEDMADDQWLDGIVQLGAQIAGTIASTMMGPVGGAMVSTGLNWGAGMVTGMTGPDEPNIATSTSEQLLRESQANDSLSNRITSRDRTQREAELLERSSKAKEELGGSNPFKVASQVLSAANASGLTKGLTNMGPDGLWQNMQTVTPNVDASPEQRRFIALAGAEGRKVPAGMGGDSIANRFNTFFGAEPGGGIVPSGMVPAGTPGYPVNAQRGIADIITPGWRQDVSGRMLQPMGPQGITGLEQIMRNQGGMTDTFDAFDAPGSAAELTPGPDPRAIQGREALRRSVPLIPDYDPTVPPRSNTLRSREGASLMQPWMPRPGMSPSFYGALI